MLPSWLDDELRTASTALPKPPVPNMKLQQVSEHCYAVLNEKKTRLCDANSALMNLDGGVIIDTQSDLAHGREMIRLFSTVWTGMPKRIILTHEGTDHVWGNQLFPGAEIIAHRSVPERMKQVAEPRRNTTANAWCW
jgi:glyoxylase-like metal-dependent hydrolase (beta-lactamase superfamily II)